MISILSYFLPTPQQKSTARISKPDVLKLFSYVQDTKLSDQNYKMVDVDQLQKFLRKDLTSLRKYKKTVHDCDDFSFILMGDVTKWDSDLAFGIAWGYNPSGTYHAFNIAIDITQQVRIIEPQTDEIFVDLDEWDIRFVIM
jgi:hypothetical protein